MFSSRCVTCNMLYDPADLAACSYHRHSTWKDDLVLLGGLVVLFLAAVALIVVIGYWWMGPEFFRVPERVKMCCC